MYFAKALQSFCRVARGQVATEWRRAFSAKEYIELTGIFRMSKELTGIFRSKVTYENVYFAFALRGHSD